MVLLSSVILALSSVDRELFPPAVLVLPAPVVNWTSPLGFLNSSNIYNENTYTETVKHSYAKILSNIATEIETEVATKSYDPPTGTNLLILGYMFSIRQQNL